MNNGSSDTLPRPVHMPLRSIGALPGPFALPLVGNMLQIKPLRVHLDMEAWARRYGSLFRVRFGRTQVLVVADHELINAVLRDRPDGFRRPEITSRLSREMGGMPGLFLAEGAEWRNQRRMVMQGFAPHAIKAYFPGLVQVALRLEQRWLAAARSGQAIVLSADLKRYTVDIIAGLAFGTEVNTIDSGDDVIQGHLDNIFSGIARRVYTLLPYWRWFKLPVDRRLDRSVAAVREAVLHFIATARARMALDPALRARPSNLLEAMIAAADEPGSGVDDATVAGNVQTMLLAGEDTTANTIGWLIYLLHANPQALARAQDEVRSIAPDCAAFSIEQMDAMHYLDACAQEAMRLKPVAPFLPVEATRDTTVGGVRVPEGTLVWCVLRHESMADSHFSNPAAFDPARWLAQEAGMDGAARADKRVTVPFGSGPRTCPGRYLALLEIKIAIAMLLGRFELAGVDTQDGQPAQEHMGFVMSPVGLRMRLRERQQG
jgi:cytochrome P450